MAVLKPWQARALASGLALAVLVAAGGGLWWTQRQALGHYQARVAGYLDQLARYRRILAERPDLERAIAAVRQRDAGRFYLKSSAPALAAADVQQAAQALMAANGLQAESVQIAPHKDKDGYRRITVSLRLRGPLAGLRRMLHELEGGRPCLVVDNLDIQASVRNGYVPVPNVEPDVLVQFDLVGFALLDRREGHARGH